MLANFVAPTKDPMKSFVFSSTSAWRRAPTLRGFCGSRDFRIRRCAPPKAAVDEARAINHPVSLCYALAVAACPIMLWVGDLAAAEHYIALLLALSARYALPSLGRHGPDLSRGARDQARRPRSGLGSCAPILTNSARCPPGFPRCSSTNWQRVSPAPGRPPTGSPPLEQAIERAEHTEARWLLPELLRIKGELLLLRRHRSDRCSRGSLPAGARLGAAARRSVLGTAGRHKPRSAAA